MKYPLTDGAKQAARELYQNWKTGKIPQHNVMKTDSEKGDVDLIQLSIQGILEKVGYPKSGALLELAKFGLIDLIINRSSDGKTKSIDVLLLQELHNAVESDFEVSEYFLTMNAVGNIIINSTTGPVQGIGYNTGKITQNVQEIADNLVATLGPEFLGSQDAVRQAIEDLRESNEASRPSKLGNVLLELGRCIHLGASTVQLMPAVFAVTQALSPLSF